MSGLTREVQVDSGDRTGSSVRFHNGVADLRSLLEQEEVHVVAGVAKPCLLASSGVDIALLGAHGNDNYQVLRLVFDPKVWAPMQSYAKLLVKVIRADGKPSMNGFIRRSLYGEEARRRQLPVASSRFELELKLTLGGSDFTFRLPTPAELAEEKRLRDQAEKERREQNRRVRLMRMQNAWPSR